MCDQLCLGFTSCRRLACQVVGQPSFDFQLLLFCKFGLFEIHIGLGSQSFVQNIIDIDKSKESPFELGETAKVIS